jgi:hypothetical protein
MPLGPAPIEGGWAFAYLQKNVSFCPQSVTLFFSTMNLDWRSSIAGKGDSFDGQVAVSYSNLNSGAIYTNFSGYINVSTVTVSGPIEAPATPHIFFFNASKGASLDVTNITEPVVAGQPIQVFAIPADTPLQPRAWNVEGTIVGGFSQNICDKPVLPPNPPCGGPIEADLTSPSPLFYWSTPTSGEQTVTYLYTLSGGQKGSVQARFKVTGPEPATVDVYPKPCEIAWWTTTELAMLANIRFVATSNASPGTYEWVQIGQLQDITVKNQQGTCLSLSVPGLDFGNGHYPTFTGSEAYDYPAAILLPGYLSASMEFQAQMYLLWNSNLAGSIPVPLGYVKWGVSESATFEPSGGFPSWPKLGGWSGPVEYTAEPAVFTTSYQYPTWNAQFGTLPCKRSEINGARP